jgi:hypothetical protein
MVTVRSLKNHNLGQDHSAGGVISDETAGENLVFGDFCYIKSDGKLWKSDANAVATMPIVAMALATINAEATGDFLLVGNARDDSWSWTIGGLLYASGTAGAVTQTAPSSSGDQVQVVGKALSATKIVLNPVMVLVEIT